MLDSYNKSQEIRDIWSNEKEHHFADGVERRGQSERIIMESSSGFVKENIEHIIEDSFKLVTTTISALQSDVSHNMDAIYSTMKEYATYGVQYIKNCITLLKCSIHNIDHWKIEELRGTSIPTTWSELPGWMTVFEYLPHGKLIKDQSILDPLTFICSIR
jgi:hypothetical protein